MSHMVPMTYPEAEDVADVELLPDQVPAFEAVGWKRKPVDPDNPPSPLPPVAASSAGPVTDDGGGGPVAATDDPAGLGGPDGDDTEADDAEQGDAAEDSNDEQGA